MRKTLVFRNIRQPQQRESWDQTKQTLTNEILNVMPELDKAYIISRTERAHRAKGNNYGTILPVFAKFSDWNFSVNRLNPVSSEQQKIKRMKLPS